MKIRINVFLFLIHISCCLCFTACGEERIQGILDDVFVPPAEVQTELPPEVWEAVKIHAPRSAFGGSIFKDAKLLEDFTTELKAYYNRYIDAGGIAIIGNESVADKYFLRCHKAVMVLTSKHPYLRDYLHPPFYMVIYPSNAGEDYFLHMPPEIVKKHEQPNSPHFFRAGWCGASYIVDDYVSGYCYASLTKPTTHASPSIRTFVHEFAHQLHTAIFLYDPEFNVKLKKAYTTAIEAGTWEGTYAEENSHEYWAEGVEFWYLHIGALDWHRYYRIFALESYEELAAHDPLLFELLDEWLPRYSLALYDFESYDQHLRNPNWR
ncbi:hypothetical protein F4X90_17740 [Candidatus Poribacteria bacterium]|nr:hypothetical protein [Candidatus Poribacteria bacterium]